jgi:CheY-like chemotaxis protein
VTKVLVVDDDPNSRVLLRKILSSMPKTEVIEAEDGAEALELARQRKPDLVLLDIMMPVMDGIEFLKRCAADEQLSKIPVMMVTALADRDRIIASVSHGARDYIVKPFDSTGLRSKVAKVLKESVAR